MKKSSKPQKQQQKQTPVEIIVPSPVYLKNEQIYIVVNGKPNSSQSVVTGIQEDCVDISIQAPAKDNEANQELISFLSKLLQIKKAQISLDKGEKSRNKLICIYDSNYSVQEIIDMLKS